MCFRMRGMRLRNEGRGQRVVHPWQKEERDKRDIDQLHASLELLSRVESTKPVDELRKRQK